VHSEAVLAGASSGGIEAALRRLAPGWPAGTRVAAILPDRGERYLDTVYDDAWCSRHFGAVPALPGAAPALEPLAAATLPASQPSLSAEHLP